MPSIDKHAPGTFCWVELGTTDHDAAKKFYGSLFGWTFVDQAMGPGGVYTIFQLGGRDCAALYSMPEAERAVDAPHWNLYVAVENADASAAKAIELGATVPAGVFDVQTAGRMAIVIDPAGAAFSVWQGKDSPGLRVMGDHNSYCWADLTTGDRLGAKKFYEALFGWKIFPGKDKDESTYLHIMSGERGIGGIQPDMMRKPGVPPHWLPYFLVADVDAVTAKAKDLGGTALVPPMIVGDSLRIAVLADAQGAVFALFQS